MRNVDSPSIVPDLTAAISLLATLAEAKREGDVNALNNAAHLFESVPGLREIVHEVANGRTYAEVQGGRWGKRARAIRQRNEKMAREYRRRELACELRGEKASFSTLAARVGRLPEFNLKKSAAIDAIRRGQHAGHSGQGVG